MKNLLSKIFWAWTNVVRFILIRLSVFLVYVVGLYFTYSIFISFDKDTTGITNASFAIVASLAALSFSAGRTIKSSSNNEDRFTYAGERFFHSAILMLIASILKYAYLFFIESYPVSSDQWYINGLKFLIGIFVGIFFFMALNSAHTGLRVLNNLLWSRYDRFKDWDKLF